MENIEGEKEEMKDEKKEDQRRKRRKKTAGSQTDEDTPNCSCHNMAATIEAINKKLDLALSRFQEIGDLKEKVNDLQKENNDFKTSLNNAHEEIAELKKTIQSFEEAAIAVLTKGIKDLQANVNVEKEREIKLESHSRRNNLNFFGIPEEAEESFASTENILCNFMKKKVKGEDVDEHFVFTVQYFEPDPSF